MPRQSPECQVEACNLQDCIGKNIFTPEKCTAQIRKLYKCCENMYASNPETQSSACPMRHVVKRWLDQHPLGENQKP